MAHANLVGATAVIMDNTPDNRGNVLAAAVCGQRNIALTFNVN
jgi:hypothetical protein